MKGRVLLLGFTIEDKGVSASLIYRLAECESVDTFSCGMLQENDIQGVLPMTFNERNGIQEVKCDIASRISFETLLKGTVGRKELLTVFGSIIDVINRVGEYLLDISLLVLEPAFIFVDPERFSVEMIFLPIIREEIWQFNERVRILFKNTIFGARFCIEEDSQYITKLINGLNNDVDFSLHDFRVLLAQLGNSNCTYQEKEEAVNLVRESSNYGTAAAVMIDNDDSKNTVIDSTNDNRHSFMHRLKIKLGLVKKVKQNESFEQNNARNANCYNNELMQDVLCNNNIKISQETSNDKEISQSNIMSFIDDTIMLVPSTCDSGLPYLVRNVNDERISICKDIFRIGKDARYADYQITDNAAVSRAHAEIITRAGVCYISDDNSLNHTYVNDSELESQVQHELNAGDVIRLADEEFVFYC